MRRFRAAAFGAAFLPACGPAHGAYQYLAPELHTIVNVGGIERHVYRIYAYFTDCDDMVVGWFGPTSDPITVQCGLPGTFFNPGGASSNTAPSLEQINGSDKTPAIPNIQWGTFATIGVPIAEMGSGPTGEFQNIDQTVLSPGFPTFATGNIFSAAGSVFAAPQPGLNSQGRADYAGDGDSLLRVLLMQLTVTGGSWLEVEIDLWVRLDGSSQTVTIDDQVPILSPPQFFPCHGADIAPEGGNGIVNVDDLLEVINGWGSCPPERKCPADTFPICDPDALVNVDDLLFVISRWGSCFDP